MHKLVLAAFLLALLGAVIWWSLDAAAPAQPPQPDAPPPAPTAPAPLVSPVTTAREPNPMRVRNILICSTVVFCASSRMMNASLSVRPRMKASGATSMTFRSMSRATRSKPIIS